MNAHLARRPSLVITTAVLALLSLVAAPALAHVTASPGEASAGEHAVIDLQVAHGCDGSPTTAITVQIPDTVASVTPEFVPGWQVETTTGRLAEPVELHGETVREGIREVTWSGGGPIPDHRFFDFGLSVLLPDSAGDTLYFPTVQTCERGETAWIEVPAEGQDVDDLELPAPSVMLVATGAHDPENAHSEPTAPPSEVATGTDAVASAGLASPAETSGGGLTLAALVIAGLALLTALGALFTARRATS